MKIDPKILQNAADYGSAEVSKSFTKLSDQQVLVKSSAAEFVDYDLIGDNLISDKENSVIVYAQIIEGIPGVSILTISRESALVLVDLLNSQPVGSTGVLLEIDRSAIKETLNILSNSYINALSKMVSPLLIIGAPYLMVSEHLQKLVTNLKNKDPNSNHAAVFKTAMEIGKYKLIINLYLIFDEGLVKLFKDE